MRILKQSLFAAFLAIAATGVVRADNQANTPAVRDPEQVREQIERLYRLEQAFLVCDHVRVTGHDLARLDDAIAEFEETSGIPEKDLEAIYEQVENAAAESADAFCSEMTGAVGEIRAIPVADKS